MPASQGLAGQLQKLVQGLARGTEECLLARPIQPHAVPQHRVKSSADTLTVRSQNSHNHLLLAVRVLWLHFQLLHIAVANLGPLSRALAFGPCKRERGVPFSCVRGLLPRTSPRCPPRTSTVPGSPAVRTRVPQDGTGRLRRTSRALTVHACGAQRQEQQEQRGRQEPHAGRRGAAREQGLGRAPGRLGSLCPERASWLRSLPLRPSVGASATARRFCGRLCAFSAASLLPPRPLLNPLLPSPQRAH